MILGRLWPSIGRIRGHQTMQTLHWLPCIEEGPRGQWKRLNLIISAVVGGLSVMDITMLGAISRLIQQSRVRWGARWKDAKMAR